MGTLSRVDAVIGAGGTGAPVCPFKVGTLRLTSDKRSDTTWLAACDKEVGEDDADPVSLSPLASLILLIFGGSTDNLTRGLVLFLYVE